MEMADGRVTPEGYIDAGSSTLGWRAWMTRRSCCGVTHGIWTGSGKLKVWVAVFERRMGREHGMESRVERCEQHCAMRRTSRARDEPGAMDERRGVPSG